MNVPAKLAGFAVALAVLGGGGAIAGGAIDPDRDTAAPHSEAAATEVDRGHTAGTDSHDDASASTKKPSHGSRGARDAHPVRGLAVASGDLRVVVDQPELERGRTETLRFRIVGEGDKTVRDFDVEHEKRMHLILARRDLTGFQHLHPTQRQDGSWTTDVRLDRAGSYRLFADFSHGDSPQTLATDLRVDGSADLRDLPAPAASAVSDGGYEVRLHAARAQPGREAELKFAIAKDGKTVHTEPYLGAGGHLVALREGDLAFLHVHPTEHGDGKKAAAGHDDSVGFAATFPTEGRYRLFLQFQHEGRVQTVAFTQEVR